MCAKIYIDAIPVPRECATISVYDHGLLYGDGVFEGIRSYGGRVFLLHGHLDRLWASAEAIELTMPVSREKMAEVIKKAAAENELEMAERARAKAKSKGHPATDAEAGYIRVVVTRGCGDLGLDPDLCEEPRWIVIADRIKLYPEKVYREGLRIVTAERMRNHPKALPPHVKSLNYLNNILAKIEGKKADCVEALMLNHEGHVAECTGDNIFIVREGILVTPPPDAGILQGITRAKVIDLAQEGQPKIEVRQESLTQDNVYSAQECFLTGTAAEIVPVVEVDDHAIGNGKPGRITHDLMQRFHQLTEACRRGELE